MIVFRQTDSRYAFLWEDSSQPAGRWHGTGEGPAHYFADTPDGAWAELLRHEEITDAEDLATIHRQMWVVDIGDGPAEPVSVSVASATGNRDSYQTCQAEARRLRQAGTRRLSAPSAALTSGAARGVVVADGPRPGPARDGRVIVVFGSPARITGWIAADGRPPADLLDRVRHLATG